MATYEKKRSVSLKGFRKEDFEKHIESLREENDIIMYYLDHIRNYRELTEEMLKNIEYFDSSNKMKIIREYNKILQVAVSLLE